MMRIAVAIILILIVACSSPTEQAGCDLFLGSAVVRGVARDFDGMPMPGQRVNIVLGRLFECDPDNPATQVSGETDDEGRYQVLVRLGNSKGNWCVFGNVVGSDSISNGIVRLQSSCEAGTPDTLDLDLFVPIESYIPPDLIIYMYRLHGFNQGPEYSVLVDGDGLIEFNGFDKTAVVGSASGSVDRTAVARLYRDFLDIGFHQLDKQYGENNCEDYAYDVHYCRTTVVAYGESKSVVHDHGCRGVAVLDSLTRLECRVDSVLSTTQWTGVWSWPCR